MGATLSDVILFWPDQKKKFVNFILFLKNIFAVCERHVKELKGNCILPYFWLKRQLLYNKKKEKKRNLKIENSLTKKVKKTLNCMESS